MTLWKGKVGITKPIDPDTLRYSPKRMVPALEVSNSDVPSMEKFKTLCGILLLLGKKHHQVGENV